MKKGTQLAKAILCPFSAITKEDFLMGIFAEMDNPYQKCENAH